MQTRELGTSGLQLSVIGLGTWAIGGGDWKFGWGDQDESSAIAAIVKAVELGINWIDTAAIYGEGRSEVLVAKAMQSIPAADRPLIATKCSVTYGVTNDNPANRRLQPTTASAIVSRRG